ncbi:5'-AMP-activated protein kinase beta subunit, interation domain-containing protein [Phyllosticta citricarpa]|uniref:5'-AMP-activated protein kinase beta subunit, interation domain-containing protein n=1 Tax=Phyllosticta citricarpa TaxID=55181 RepID=A0ABR1LVC7_9PEZI
MGNNPSSSRQSASSPQSPTTHAAASSLTNAPVNNVRREPRRRESIQALANVKATAAPPSASLESATAHPTLRPRPESQGTGRAQSGATPQLKPQDIAALERMGSDQSYLKEVPEQHPSAQAATSPFSRPVDVPAASPRPVTSSSAVDAASSQNDNYHMQAAAYNRPPRLPLPIEEEVHTPGSPIISPTDLHSSITQDDVEGVLPGRAPSVLSSTTADDEDAGDESLETDGVMRPAVPTVIEWLGPGEKVYVTGTFAGWNKKFRLHKNGPSKHKDAFSATINLQPGTHHLKFLVDNDMVLSPELPTAVDFTNILVNYLEVSPDDLPQPQPSDPVDIPGQQAPAKTASEARDQTQAYQSQAVPSSPDGKPSNRTDAAVQGGSTAVETSRPVPVAPAPPKKYHSEIPQFLADLDAEEESSRFTRASTVMNSLPPSPTLPVMLSKSILNGSMPMKDDSSVLNMPNHTVLNHLATSSIKHNVLATSATTRYKRKASSAPWFRSRVVVAWLTSEVQFLTTIMYKPTSDTGE